MKILILSDEHEHVYWNRAFLNININEQEVILSKTILNILSNFIPHETLTVDDKDPPLFTKKIKNLIQRKTMFIKAIEIAKTTITFNN